MGKFTRDTIGTFMTNVALTGIGLALSIVIARGLGPEGRGLYSMCAVFVSLLVSFADFGIPMATAYSSAHGDFAPTVIAGNNIILSAALGSAAAVCGISVVVWFPKKLMPGVPLELILMAIPVFLFALSGGYLRHILLGVRLIRELNLVALLQSVLMLAFSLTFLLGFGLGVRGLLLSLILSNLVVLLMVLAFVKRSYGWPDFRLNAPYIRRAFGYGGKIYFASILSFLNYKADVFIVNYFLNPFSVGIYATAVGLSEQMWTASQAASTMLFPRIAAEKDEAARNRITPMTCRIVLLVSVIGAALLALAAPLLIKVLYSGRFLPAVLPLRIILVGTINLIVWKFLSNDIAARGRPGLIIVINAMAAASNIGANLLLIPRIGVPGAAWASAISYTVAGLLSMYFYRRLSGNPYLAVLLPQRSDLALVAHHLKELASRWARGWPGLSDKKACYGACK